MTHAGTIIKLLALIISSIYMSISAQSADIKKTEATHTRYGVAYNPFAATPYLTHEGSQAMIDGDILHFRRLNLNLINIILPSSAVNSDNLNTLDYLTASLSKSNIESIITITELSDYPIISNVETQSAPEALSPENLAKRRNTVSGKNYSKMPQIKGIFAKPDKSLNSEGIYIRNNKQVPYKAYTWYPLGKDAPFEYRGNLLPTTDIYNVGITGEPPYILSDATAAGSLQTYLYPAMTRTLRTKGFDHIIAGHYDPTPIAGYNTETPDDYLNLLYTPGKAIGLMIGAEASTIPSGAYYGDFPENMMFDDFAIYPSQNLAMLNTPEKYYHTGSTHIAPVSIEALKHVAGVGDSPLIKYDGSGAYFLDKIPAYGIWCLEILPDASIISDPFESPDNRYAKGLRGSNPHLLQISDQLIPENFVLLPYNNRDSIGGAEVLHAENSKLTVTPGIYLAGPSDNIRLIAGATDLSLFIPGTNISIEDRVDDGKTHLSLPVKIIGSDKFDRILYGTGDLPSITTRDIPSKDGDKQHNSSIQYNKEITSDNHLRIRADNPTTSGYIEIQKYIGDLIQHIPDMRNRHGIVVRFKEMPKLEDSALLQISDTEGRVFSEIMEIDTTKITGKEARVYFDRMWGAPSFTLPHSIPEAPTVSNSDSELPVPEKIESIRLLFPVEANKPFIVEIKDITLE